MEKIILLVIIILNLTLTPMETLTLSHYDIPIWLHDLALLLPSELIKLKHHSHFIMTRKQWNRLMHAFNGNMTISYKSEQLAKTLQESNVDTPDTFYRNDIFENLDHKALTYYILFGNFDDWDFESDYCEGKPTHGLIPYKFPWFFHNMTEYNEGFTSNGNEYIGYINEKLKYIKFVDHRGKKFLMKTVSDDRDYNINFIKNVVMFKKLLSRFEVPGESYNLGHNDGKTLDEIFDTYNDSKIYFKLGPILLNHTIWRSRLDQIQPTIFCNELDYFFLCLKSLFHSDINLSTNDLLSLNLSCYKLYKANFTRALDVKLFFNVLRLHTHGNLLLGSATI